MRLAIRIDQQGNLSELDLDSPIASALTVLQGAVGGNIETAASMPGLDMYANEEGLFIFQPGVDDNVIASLIFARAYNTYQPILGPVVFTGGADLEGETVGLSRVVADDLRGLVTLYAGKVASI